MFKIKKSEGEKLLEKGGLKKFFRRFGISLGIIIIIGTICIGILWRNEIVALSSLKQINDGVKNYPFYTMTYKGNYGFDDYLEMGSKSAAEYKQFILKEITNGLDGVFKREPPNCSSFTVVMPNGDKIFARNLDTNIAIPLFLKTNSKGYKSMSMVNLRDLGIDIKKLPLSLSRGSINMLGAPYVPLEGMNEHGLAISILTAGGSRAMIKKNKSTLNEFSLIRMVLDKASTVEEAVKMIENYNMNFLSPQHPSHFMIADATGASVVIEYLKGELQTIYSNKPYHIVTNFVLYNNPSGGFGLDRYQGIEAKLKETKGILTEKQALKLLEENTISGDEQWSAVYNLTQKRVSICVGKDYKTIHEFGLN